ncbi:translation elongation factor Ts [Patescibacteria group bacterium]|nr:MAG: translation elongation factor Ts [Patescibacteria group bacterium]
MSVEVADIKKLRELTGAGMMDAKKALVEAGGDFEAAVTAMRKKGAARVAKRGDREAKEGTIASYVHGGKIGVLVEVNCETDFVARTEDFQEFARNMALQIAAANPQYLDPESVPEAEIAKEKEVFAVDVEGKPAEIADKIIDGKLAKFYESVCLTKQPFIKDGDQTIEQMMTDLSSKLGERIVIRQFKRIELGGEL